MLDDDICSEEMIARAFEGKTEGLSKDDVLDNVTLYSDTAQVSNAGFLDVRGVQIPVAASSPGAIALG